MKTSVLWLMKDAPINSEFMLNTEHEKERQYVISGTDRTVY